MKIITAPWIAVDIGSDAIHLATVDADGKEQEINLPDGEGDAIFYLSPEGRELLLGKRALAKLDDDPQGIILLRTTQLKRDETIRLPDGRCEIKPSFLFAALLRHVREYCQTHLFRGRSLQSCVLAIPHRHDRIRSVYTRIAREAGFHHILLRDAAVAAATIWKQGWEAEADYVVVCNLAATRVCFSLLHCRSGGVEKIDQIGSTQTVGIGDIDLMAYRIVAAAGGHDELPTYDQQLRLKLARRHLSEQTSDSFPILNHGLLREIKSDHFSIAIRTIAAKIRDNCQEFLHRCSLFAGRNDFPVVLVGGGTNIPAICEAVEEMATGKVYWWGDAEKAVAIGTAALLLPKTLPPKPTVTEQQFQQLFLAAEKGEPTACYYLGKALIYGHGTARSPEEAVDWLRIAANAGNAKAKYRLAELLYMGHGIIRDKKSAQKLLQDAAEQGNDKSQFLWGKFLFERCPDQAVEAERWIRKAAEQRNAKAVAYLEKNFDKPRKSFSLPKPQKTDSSLPKVIVKEPAVTKKAKIEGMTPREIHDGGGALLMMAPALERLYGLLGVAVVCLLGSFLFYANRAENPVAVIAFLLCVLGGAVSAGGAAFGLGSYFWKEWQKSKSRQSQ